MKRKILKSFLALTLMITMAFSLCLNTFAINSNETANITISGLDDKRNSTVTAYQVIDIDYDHSVDQPKSPTYFWFREVNNWITNNFPDYINNDGSVAISFVELDDPKLKIFVDQLAATIKQGNVNISSKDPVTVNNKNSADYNLPMGAYLFLVNDGINIYSPGFAKVYPVFENNQWNLSGDNILVNLKRSAPSIEKTVDKKTVAIGDLVTYTLTIELPQYPSNAIHKTLKISDKIGDGLTFNEYSIRFTIKDTSGNVIDVTPDFEKVKNSDKTFEYSIIDEKYDEIQGYETLTVTYTATVNNDAYDQSLENTATLTYNTEPYAETSHDHSIDDSTQVYTYGMKITKIVDDTNDNVTGTEFELYKGDNTNGDPLKFNENNGIYTFASVNGSTTLTVDDDGTLVIKGLDVGTYTLKEIKAPAGYTIPQTTTIVTLEDVGSTDSIIDGELDSSASTATGENLENNSVKIDDNNKNQLNFTIINYKNELNLPKTGGMGTMMFTIAGIALMGGAVVLMLVATKKRKA